MLDFHVRCQLMRKEESDIPRCGESQPETLGLGVFPLNPKRGFTVEKLRDC